MLLNYWTVVLRRYWPAGLLGVLLFMSISSTPARAEGGPSIASAPAVAYGQQEFGNLANSIVENCDKYYRSWWTLPVVAGDSVQIDWEAQDSYARLNLFAPGTTDFNFPQTSTVAYSQLNNNLKAELTYQVAQSGSMPLEFAVSEFACSASTIPGPYSFTAYVVHSVRLFIARPRTLPLRGTLSVAVHTPTGEPVTDPNLQVSLEVKLRGHWYTIGHAAVANAIASVPFTVPGGLYRQHVSLRAIAHGPAYQSATSAPIRVRVR